MARKGQQVALPSGTIFCGARLVPTLEKRTLTGTTLETPPPAGRSSRDGSRTAARSRTSRAAARSSNEGGVRRRTVVVAWRRHYADATRERPPELVRHGPSDAKRNARRSSGRDGRGRDLWLAAAASLRARPPATSRRRRYSLWHTILELADEAKCLTYDGSIYRDFTYTGARGSNWDGSARDEFGPDAQKRKGSRPGTKLPLLSCAQMQETCPGWTFDDCTRKSSRLVEKVFVHDSIDQANGTTTYSFDRGELVVEMPAFTLGSEPGPGRRPVSTTYPTYTHKGHTFIVYDHAALEGKLGISDRDRERHPWGEP